MNESPERRDAGPWVLVGVALILLGLFFGARSMGILPQPVYTFFGLLGRARNGIGIILLGVALIWWAQGHRGFTTPARGTKLYRSRDNKWLGGVLGGLADYFGTDATLLRLAFIALVIALDMGALVFAYIVMWVIVPVEPSATTYAAPAQANWPATGAPPAPPVPPPPAEHRDPGQGGGS